MAKILITGGAGYIGSILTEYILKDTEYEITIVDNFSYGETSLNHLCHYKKLTILNVDVRDNDFMIPLYKSHQIVIPLAALVGAPLCLKDKIGAKTINTNAVETLLIHSDKSTKIIMPTTNSAYGSGDSQNYCDENSPLNPISIYAKEKVDLEKKLLDRGNCISLRLATVFGLSPRMRLDLLVNDFCYRAFRDKYLVLFESHFKRNYIHIRDVSRVFIHCLNNFDLMKDNIFNVGLEDTNISKKELCIAIKKHIPSFDFFENNFTKDPDQRNYIVSNQKIIATGFKTKFSLDFGIQELLKGYVGLKNYKFGNI